MPETSPLLNAAQPAAFTLTIPAQNNRLRLSALGCGAILFVWSSLEDNGVLPIAILGTALAVILVTLWVTAKLAGKTFATRNALLFAAFAGAATGLTTALTVAALMLMKNGLHAHLFPDYPFGLIVDILARAPLWALAGIFAGIGLLLAWWGFRQKGAQAG